MELFTVTEDGNYIVTTRDCNVIGRVLIKAVGEENCKNFRCRLRSWRTTRFTGKGRNIDVISSYFVESP